MSQTLCNTLIHIVFSAKNRANQIRPDIESELYPYIIEICKLQNSPLLQIGGTENHLHLLVSLSRNIPLAKLVAEIKANSSRWIKTKGDIYDNFAWQNGYGAFSIGQSGYQHCINYIKNQKTHHQILSFEDELRQLLKKYEIAFDEKYLWN